MCIWSSLRVFWAGGHCGGGGVGDCPHLESDDFPLKNSPSSILENLGPLNLVLEYGRTVHLSTGTRVYTDLLVSADTRSQRSKNSKIYTGVDLNLDLREHLCAILSISINLHTSRYPALSIPVHISTKF